MTQIIVSMDFEGNLRQMSGLRGYVVRCLDEALGVGLITRKERDIMYMRHIDWNSLETVGKKFGVTRERIRQIEAKVIVKIKHYGTN